MMTNGDSIIPPRYPRSEALNEAARKHLIDLVEAQRLARVRLLKACEDARDFLDRSDPLGARAVILAAIEFENDTIVDLLERVYVKS